MQQKFTNTLFKIQFHPPILCTYPLEREEICFSKIDAIHISKRVRLSLFTVGRRTGSVFGAHPKERSFLTNTLIQFSRLRWHKEQALCLP